MKILKTFTTVFIFGLSLTLSAENPHHKHVKHNMVIFGETEIFLSHIVYKSPHNYQVLLKIEPDEEFRQIYGDSRKNHPDDDYIFLLDGMNIAEIADSGSISGTLFRTDETGLKTILSPDVKIDRLHFKVFYFNELPLSLEK